MTTSARYVSAQEAAELLGISQATLYSYVSRGLIRSEMADSARRQRRYHLDDVEALLARKEYRREPGRAAQSAMSFGMPVLDSAITMIQDGRLFYRGCDALALAQERTVEEVAALVWLDRLDAEELFASQRSRVEKLRGLSPPGLGMANPIEFFQIILARAGMEDLAAHATDATAIAATGSRILQLLVGAASGQPTGLPIARALQMDWVSNLPEAVGLISAALILCADHELNVSAFTARCVASAGATPYAVVIAGLSALQGHRHGGHTARVAALLRAGQAGVSGALAEYLKAGESLPGFGHPLYPDGDPRARLLLTMTAERRPQAPAVALAHELCHAVFDTLGLLPTIDFALEVLVQALGLPDRAALALFALGRAIGWIGHASEQVATGQLIRPRARYTGHQPRLLW
jgi:citrate synthase